jgi:TfoX/Sxy family transcriptional regulator of competence genes
MSFSFHPEQRYPRAMAAKKMKPAAEPWVKAFTAAVAGDARVEQRKMFGYPAIFTGGNMAAGLHEHGLVLRLADADREELLSVGGKPFAPMAGRVMSGFALAPDSFVKRPKELRAWLDRSIEYASSLPPKTKKR